MKKQLTFRLVVHSLLATAITLLGCQRLEPAPAASKTTPVNQLSMRINGQAWSPYQPPADPCKATYYGQYGELNYGGSKQQTQYLIRAYRDSTGRADAYSTTVLGIQLIDVAKPGSYVLKGSWKEDFVAYAVFKISTSPTAYKRYVNQPNRHPFTVIVTEITREKYAYIPGIIGTFSGTLYNEDNPNDSLKIDQGNFTLRYMGGYNCGL